MKPHPVNLREVLSTLEPWRMAKFLHTEAPIRFAERIRWIEDLPGWEEVDDLRAVHDKHIRAFSALRGVDRHPTLDPFSRAVKSAVEQQGDVPARMARGMVRWQKSGQGADRSSDFVDAFLNKFLLNRLGSNVLMTQYLACVDMLARKYPPTGIVDPQCDVASVCREAAHEVLDICAQNTGLRPVVNVEAHSVLGGDRGVPRFSYIPSFLRYTISELLKNSCRATTELVRSEEQGEEREEEELQARPITIVVCADAHHVAIRLSDRARGIPFDVGPRIWSYLYTTTRRSEEGPTALAGYGVGLPLSRLYANYLGGSLDLISLPGYGTDAYLMLPRVEAEMVEVVPDSDSAYRVHTLTDYLF